MTHEEILKRLNTAFPQSVVGHEEFRGDLSVVIRREDLPRVALFLKEDAQCRDGVPEIEFDHDPTDERFPPPLENAIFRIVQDVANSADRFEVVYIVYSLKNKQYLRFRVTLAEEHPAVATVTNVWPGANWYEREAYDMFGIRFEGHPDLRRMYMPEEFEYYPLRKDFPLMGIPDSLPLPRR